MVEWLTCPWFYPPPLNTWIEGDSYPTCPSKFHVVPVLLLFLLLFLTSRVFPSNKFIPMASSALLWYQPWRILFAHPNLFIPGISSNNRNHRRPHYKWIIHPAQLLHLFRRQRFPPQAASESSFQERNAISVHLKERQSNTFWMWFDSGCYRQGSPGWMDGGEHSLAIN